MRRFGIFKKKSNMVYGLTSRGKKRAEESAGRTPEGLIVCMLEEHGESSPSEIANETHLELGVVKNRLKRMRRQDLVKAKSEDEEYE